MAPAGAEQPENWRQSDVEPHAQAQEPFEPGLAKGGQRDRQQPQSGCAAPVLCSDQDQKRLHGGRGGHCPKTGGHHLEHALKKRAIPTDGRYRIYRKTPNPNHQKYAEKTQKAEYITRRIDF